MSRHPDGEPHGSGIDNAFDIDAELDLGISICIFETEDKLGVLKRFNAHAYTYDDASEQLDVASLVGWIGWRVLDEDVADAADAISSDAAYIGYVAAQLLEDDANDSLIEDVVLLDRMWIEPEFRGHGLLGELVSNCQYLWIEEFSGGLLPGFLGGWFVGAFDEFAVLELGTGPDERDQVWCVHGAPA